MADEPTGNLDTRTSHEIMETLRRAQPRSGVTVIIVTHEADIAAYADRIVTMRDGKIVSDADSRAARTALAEAAPRAAAQPPAPPAATASALWASG